MMNASRHPTTSRRDLLVFAGLWLVFWMGLGWFVPRSGSILIGVAGFIGACTLFALVWPGDAQRGKYAIGFVPAAVLLLLGLASQSLPAAPTLVVGSSIGLLGAILSSASPTAGAALYRAWMAAFFPVGWAVSHLLLAFVFFAVLTPTGLLMWLVGRDPLQRRWDRSASSYWIPRRTTSDSRRYFRQS
jgi:Saxitoxin biosynthesis operon protein SxtJ